MDKKLRKNILKGSAATTIGTISANLFNFLTVMVLARYVSKDDLGIYVLIIVISNMFNLLGGFGLDLTLVKFIASKKEGENQNILIPVLNISVIGSLLISIVFIVTGRYIMHLFDDRIYHYIWYILAIFTLANYRDLFYKLMQGLNQFKQYSIVNVSSSAFRIFVLVIFLLVTKIDIRVLLIIEILCTLQPLVHQLFVIQFKKYMRIKPTWETYKKIIGFSFPLYLHDLVDFLTGRMNIFIIAAYLNLASIANFDIARKAPIALSKMFGSFIIVYFPNLSALFSEGNKKTAVGLIEKSIGIFSISMVFLVSFSFLFRNELTVLLFSPRYAGVSLAFALLMLNFLMSGLNSLMGYAFTSAGHSSVPVRISSVGAVISIGLAFLFVPIYGYMGAVYALLAMNIVSIFLNYSFMVKYSINPLLKSFLKPSALLLIAPVSLLFNGQFFLPLNSLLFISILFLGWIISEDLRSTLGLLFSYIKKYNWGKTYNNKKYKT